MSSAAPLPPVCINLALSFDDGECLYVRVDGSALPEGRSLAYRAQDKRSSSSESGIDRSTLADLAKHFACAAKRLAEDASCRSVPLNLTTLFHAVFQSEGKNEFLFSALRSHYETNIILLRIFTEDPLLRNIPWEMMSKDITATANIHNTAFGNSAFLGTVPFLLVVRGTVKQKEPQHQKKEAASVPERVNVLGIFGENVESEQTAIRDFFGDLYSEKSSSEKISYSKYLTYAQLNSAGDNCFNDPGLRIQDDIHIVHIVAHGEVAPDGHHRLKFRRDDDAAGASRLDGWLATSVVARRLCGDPDALRLTKSPPMPRLRLVILQSCSSAATGSASNFPEGSISLLPAVDVFINAGVDAVLAFLADVPTNVASEFMHIFLQKLLDSPHNVAYAVREARLQQIEKFPKSRTAFFAPVLYLRSDLMKLFVLPNKDRHSPLPPRPPVGTPIDKDLAALLRDRDGFSVLLGNIDNYQDEEGIWKRLRPGLIDRIPLPDLDGDTREKALSQLPVHDLAQLVMYFSRGKGFVEQHFQSTATPPDKSGESSSEIYSTVAGALPPGIHISLQLFPWLEAALENLQSGQRIISIAVDWHQDRENYHKERLPARIYYLDVQADGSTPRLWVALTIDQANGFLFQKNDIIVIRINGGFMLTNGSPVIVSPAMTEDDFALQVQQLTGSLDLRKLISSNRSFKAHVKKFVNTGVLAIGLSAFDWPQRALVHALMYNRKNRSESVAMLYDSQQEADRWMRSRDFPSRPKSYPLRDQIGRSGLAVVLQAAIDHVRKRR